jgi:hypothetical protein
MKSLISSGDLVLLSMVRVFPISLIGLLHFCPTSETDPPNRSLVLVLLVGIGVWTPPQSPSSFKVGPFDLKEFPALSRYPWESSPDLFSRACILIVSIQTLPSMSRNYP